jgi:dihydroxyacetone kinase DhaKLM complex PTS-EIIA-like component DhaM
VGVSTFIVRQKSVILVDVSYKTLEDAEEIRATLQAAKELIASSRENSVYIITDVSNTKFNPEIVTEMSNFVASNSKYIKASVIIGISEANKIIYSAIKNIKKREFILANSLFEAKKIIGSF